ncbi:DUF5693 family protein [Syntrophothermus lipocalidus]|uniref:Uncharacterized protein n=1 Tax=Syntrophothermus lipocalidus (strain DSM 12680 / TGB-C1) TaxID=643648 RepID=D7CJ67_SYNLT|nr:DUF5693 family protein [Syntrophothermus lipocalidus]ADI00956.1 conserved hypothetical protein [Syntrophothermus lipocalidus DSM 12680]
MQLTRSLKLGLIAVIVIAVVSSAYTAYRYRFLVEKDFRQVELLASYGDIVSLAGAEGMTAREGMSFLKERGLTGVVIQEPTVEDLVKRGDAVVYQGRQLVALLDEAEHPSWLSELQARGYLEPSRTYLVATNPVTGEQLARFIPAKLPNSYCLATEDGCVVGTVAPYEVLKDIGAGFSLTTAREVSSRGLDVFLQVRTWPGANRTSIGKVFGQFADMPGLAGIVFNDTTVPGYPGALDETARQMAKLGVPVAEIEFYPQAGLPKLARLLDQHLVRLHTLNDKDQKSLSSSEAIDRYVLAAAERNHRLLLFKPLSNEKSLAALGHMISATKQRLLEEGLSAGPASTLPASAAPLVLVFVAGLGVIAGGVLLFAALGWRRWLVGLALAAAAVWVLLLYADRTFAAKLMALTSVLVFPTLGVLTGVDAKPRTVGRALSAFVKMSGVSLLGAVFMVGLLADSSFMLKLNQFAGVKLAHAVPLGVVAVFFVLKAAPGRSLREKIEGMMVRPLETGMALGGLVLAAALAVYLIRTGNEGLPVSGLELKLRTLLDHIMGARPRTKEFALGHPAMLLLLLYGYRNNRFLPLLVLAAIGQVSMVNTFAHIHTPLMVSVLRTCNGLVLGLAVGLVAYAAVKVLGMWWERLGEAVEDEPEKIRVSEEMRD